MASKVIMPKQGLQMTEGYITKWLVSEGEDCLAGQPLFEMETDKLTITIDAPASGTILKIVRQAGETVPITETIAIIGSRGEDITELLAQTEATDINAAEATTTIEPQAAQVQAAVRAPGEQVFITPRAKKLAADHNIDYSRLPASGPENLIIEKDIADYIANMVKATPLAKKIAEINELDIQGIQGSGDRGKITKGDVLRVSSARVKPAADRHGKLLPFSGMRKVIADRMLQSLQTNAQTTHRVSVDMTEAVRLRDAYKTSEMQISYNDIISFAVCRSLIEFPAMNAELTTDGILVKDFVNLGIAVAIDNGLIVPVIKDADLLTLAELSAAAKILAAKAKEGKLEPNDYRGGSFTISNLGMFGLSDFVAIINPPECGILAVGKLEKQAVVIDDQLAIRPMMNLVLSYDHRLIDGAPAAKFLVRIKQLLENPFLMLIN
jgi:pyruvate dehydrogenase E2 component (dihydrolipoamide acetyltransferase)